MSEAKHDLLLKLLALLVGLGAVDHLSSGLSGGGGLFGKLFVLVAGLLWLAVAVGFWRRQHWAYLLVSLGLLAGFFIQAVRLILAVDTGGDVLAEALCQAAIIAAIAYLGRTSMEARFRPELRARLEAHRDAAPQGS